MNNVISLIVGALVAAGIGALVYTQRERIRGLQTTAERRVKRAQASLSRNVDSRYRSAIRDLANSWHIAGHLTSLEQIAVLPRFYTLSDPHDPLENEQEEEHLAYEGPLNMLPVSADWPYAMGPYQIPGIPLSRLLRGDDSIALLGLPGSGRTVALALIALLVAQQTDDEQQGGLLDETRLPVLIHLADLDLSLETWGEDEVDPLLPLLEAAAQRLRGFVSRAAAAIRGPFAAGRGLILIDGWDELPPRKRQQAVEFLKVLVETYPGNKLVVTGPVRGFKPLQDLGLAPTFVMPWGNKQFNELGQLWAAAWPLIEGTEKNPAPEPNPDVVRRAVRDNIGRTPLDVTLKVWTVFAKDDPGMGRRGWYVAYFNRVLPAPSMREGLEKLAATLYDRPDEYGMAIDQVTKIIDEARSALRERPGVSTPDFLYSITNETHVLTERTGKLVDFTQPVVAAYLAAEAFKDKVFKSELLEDTIENNVIMAFMGSMMDITPYVEHRMAGAGSILNNATLALGVWAADGDQRAAWRGNVFKHLASFLIGPVAYPLARERAMAALVASRDRNVNFVFIQGLKNIDWRVRILSALGLGAIGDPEMVTTLGELIGDPDQGVQVAAALALGAIGTKPAVNYMIQGLLSGADLTRRAIGEMLALDLAGEGHDILREAVQEQDAATRKAAVYGLGMIEEDWVTELLETTEMRDDQWLVRAAATGMLDLRRKSPQDSPEAPGRPETTVWLERWLNERNLSASPGPEGIRQLVRALQEGDVNVRVAASDALGALAVPEAITPLYAALRDPEAPVRDSAYRALAAISTAAGHTLPSVM